MGMARVSGTGFSQDDPSMGSVADVGDGETPVEDATLSVLSGDRNRNRGKKGTM